MIFNSIMLVISNNIYCIQSGQKKSFFMEVEEGRRRKADMKTTEAEWRTETEKEFVDALEAEEIHDLIQNHSNWSPKEQSLSVHRERVVHHEKYGYGEMCWTWRVLNEKQQFWSRYEKNSSKQMGSISTVLNRQLEFLLKQERSHSSSKFGERGFMESESVEGPRMQ